MRTQSRNPLTTRFLHRTVLFSTVFSAGLAFFYLFGNLQDFLDSTQILILSTVSASSIATVILSVFLVILELILFRVQKKKINYFMLFLTGVCLLAGIFLSLVSNSIILLSHGF
jgi:hypothetical protein